jgi:general secretion pathway protein A
MYQEFFQLDRMPFENTADPYFFFSGDEHCEALAALTYGARQHRGVTLVTARAGCGKTLLGRMLLESLGTRCHAVTIGHCPADGRELIASVTRGCGIPITGAESAGELFEHLQAALLANRPQDRPTVVVLDEVHRLTTEVLEHLCMLAGMETAESRLLQFALLSEPGICHSLREPRLEQLSQRVFCAKQLHPFDAGAGVRYIRHRLERAGAASGNLMTTEAAELIQERSGGIPRLINQMADNALLVAYGAGQRRVDDRVVSEALSQMLSLTLPAAAGPRETGAELRRRPASSWSGGPSASDTRGLVPAAPGDLPLWGERYGDASRELEALAGQQKSVKTSLGSALAGLSRGQDELRRRVGRVSARCAADGDTDS